MATNDLNYSGEELPLTTTGEPADQLAPEESKGFGDESNLDDGDGIDLNTGHLDFDNEPLDDDGDLDEDEVKRLFPGEESNSDNDKDEPYEGIRHGDEEDEGLADDNMSGMPVIPSPS